MSEDVRSRKAQDLLKEEIKLLNEIEMMRQNYLHVKQKENNEKCLDKIGAPVKRTGYNSKKNVSIKIQRNH